MKRNYIVKGNFSLSLLVGLILVTAACKQKKQTDTKQAEKPAAAHHNLVDTSLNELLKPVNERVMATIPVISASKGSSVYIKEVSGRIAYDSRQQSSISSRVSGRIEKIYIKYNYQPVKKGQLILTLYSPDLAAAQRELLLIGNSVNTGNSGSSGPEDHQLLQSARQKLILLGMSAAQVNKVLKTGQISYTIPVYSNANGYILEQSGSSTNTPASAPVPQASSAMDNMGGNSGGNEATKTVSASPISSAVMLREGQYLNAGQRIFTIYESSALVAEFFLPPAEAAQISKQAKVIIQPVAGSRETVTGKIGLIQPVINAGENFVLARVYLGKNKLQVGELITGKLPFLTETAFWLPKEAVLSLGNQSVVFRKDGRSFVPKTVKTGVMQNGQVQIMDDIRDWAVAKNAWYLVDSESFIKIKNERD